MPTVATVGGGLATLGFGLFASNLVLVLRRHSPDTLAGTLFDAVESGDDREEATPAEGTTGPGN